MASGRKETDDQWLDLLWAKPTQNCEPAHMHWYVARAPSTATATWRIMQRIIMMIVMMIFYYQLLLMCYTVQMLTTMIGTILMKTQTTKGCFWRLLVCEKYICRAIKQQQRDRKETEKKRKSLRLPRPMTRRSELSSTQVMKHEKLAKTKPYVQCIQSDQTKHTNTRHKAAIQKRDTVRCNDY